MLTLARESRGLTQKELAERLEIFPAKLCRIELGNQPLDQVTKKAMSKVLNYPASFFIQEGEALPMSLNFRKRANVAQKLLMPIEGQINIYRLNIESLLKALKLPSPKIPILDLKEFGNPIEAAKQLRKIWKMPKGPVTDLIGLVEEKGIIALSFDFGTERVDSRTILTHGGYPLLILNKANLGDRQRFSLAFELGHLVMHQFTLPELKRDIDHEANLFAASFLMPEEEIRKDMVGDISVPKLAELKPKWKVSMQALLFRADDLGLITVNQKKYLLQQFNTLKIRRREPPELDVPREKPLLLRNLIFKYREEQNMSVEEMAAFFHLTHEEFLLKYTE